MPEERRMTITSSSHLAPDDVARHTFASVRRGFDPTEVRDYLESIASGLRAHAEREQELLAALADAEQRAANPVIDDTMLTAAVGKETARVLQSAHDAAAEMVGNAEARTARMLAEATQMSERLVSEATQVSEEAQSRADTLLAERLAEANAASTSLQERTEQQVAAALDKVRSDAEELTERARSEGRVMVEEAQALRARVLTNLSRRRKVLHAQIEQLRAGRERLAETVNDVKRSVEVIAEELFNAENQARLAAEVAGRDAANRPDEGTPEELAASLLAEEAVASTEATTAAGPGGGAGAADEEIITGEPAVAAEAGAGAAPAAGPDHDEGGSGPGSVPEATDAEDVPAPPVEKVDALFAKLRAAQDGTEGTDREEADTPTRTAADESGTDGSDADGPVDADKDDDGPPEPTNPLAVRRDELLAPIITGLARRLKRSLQDYQNELLDSLRAKGTSWSTDLLADETEHLDSVTTAALPALEEAAVAGAVFIGAGGGRPEGDAVVAISHDLAESVVGPLRRRLSQGEGLEVAEESVVTEHVGSAFREWKGERFERLAGDHVVAAFSLGSMAAAGATGTSLEWLAVSLPDAVPCPDCEDNGLNGAQAAGEDFPTGHSHPPAHPGCRCLLTPGTP
jgi:DivIVA domain-containing protein